MASRIRSSGGQQEMITAFWRWFLTNESRLFSFDADQGTLVDDLIKNLSAVDDRLMFEIGPDQGGTREFVISAGGIKEAFPAVRSLAAASPPLPRWRIVEFRQRRPQIDTISCQGLSLSSRSVRFTLRREGRLAGVTLYLPGYAKEDHARYLTLAFLLLDNALGENDVEEKLGSIDLRPLGPGSGNDAMESTRLPTAFDEFLRSWTN